MGLEKDSGRVTYVNIKEGKLYTKEKGGEPDFFRTISGTIVKVSFKEEEYKGKRVESAQFTIVDGPDRFLLQMRTDSGYFRDFCNALRTGDPTSRFSATPTYKVKDEKPKTGFIISQNGTPLKHAFTKANMGELPLPESREWKGEIQWDGSKQIKFWKAWLNSIEFVSEFLASGETEFKDFPVTSDSPKKAIPENPDDLTEPLDDSDLPF